MRRYDSSSQKGIGCISSFNLIVKFAGDIVPSPHHQLDCNAFSHLQHDPLLPLVQQLLRQDIALFSVNNMPKQQMPSANTATGMFMIIILAGESRKMPVGCHRLLSRHQSRNMPQCLSKSKKRHRIYTHPHLLRPKPWGPTHKKS